MRKLGEIFGFKGKEKKRTVDPEYPNALSRDPYREGGYGFFHRIFAQNIQTGKPVEISTGGMILQYNYKPGDASFIDGIQILRGSKSDEAYEALIGVSDSFDLDEAKKRNKLE